MGYNCSSEPRRLAISVHSVSNIKLGNVYINLKVINLYMYVEVTTVVSNLFSDAYFLGKIRSTKQELLAIVFQVMGPE